MTPQRQIGTVLVLGCLLAGPSFAEIINVSVDGAVSGSEAEDCFVFGCTSGSSDFSNVKSQPGYGMYALSGSGSATADLPSGLLQPTATGNAQQTADTTSGSFSLDLKSGADADGASGSNFGSSTVFNSLTLSFYLTQPSLLDLSGSLSEVCLGPVGGGAPCSSLPYLFSPFSVESIDLSGSGFDFNQQMIF